MSNNEASYYVNGLIPANTTTHIQKISDFDIQLKSINTHCSNNFHSS